MKFKNFVDHDIEEFRKLNVGIIKESEAELVRKIEEKYGLRNNAVGLIKELNKLLGKKKFGFTFDLVAESSEIDKEVKKVNKKRLEAIKMKFFESNSLLSEMKRELEEKINREK